MGTGKQERETQPKRLPGGLFWHPWAQGGTTGLGRLG